MKKKLLVLTLLLLITACSKENPTPAIPAKNDISDTSAKGSSITTQNIDDYLFRDDCQYVDLRPYSWAIKDGYIAGFSFYPFYDLIAHTTETDRLFSFDKIKKEDGSVLLLGEVGTFTSNYVESEQVIKRTFNKEKNILVISQSGLEGCYFLNLLIQLGYNQEMLYNIGGFSISPGFECVAYKNLDNPKYLVQGNNLISYENTTFGAFKELTPK